MRSPSIVAGLLHPLCLLLIAILAAVGAGCGAPTEGSDVPSDVIDDDVDPEPSPGPSAEPDVAPEPDAEPEPVVACAAADQLDELLERLDNELSAQGIPGGAAAIACADGTVVAGGVGVIGAAGEEPVLTTTRFQIASVSKTLTAAAALRMQQAELLDTKAPLDGLLPDVNTSTPYSESLTLEQLLAHTAGYPTDIPDGVFFEEELEGFYADNANVQLWSPPGRVWNYANYGYGLAGLAMERAADTPFAALMDEHLLTPFGIDGTFDVDAVLAHGDYAIGHEGTAAAPIALTPTDSYYRAGWYGPMGGGWLSAEGLGHFASLLLQASDADKAFGPIAADMASPRLRTDSAPDFGYGQGLFIDESGSTPLWTHGGGVAGFLTGMDVFPDAGVAVIILINGDWAFPRETTAWAQQTLGGYTPATAWGDLNAGDVVGTYQDDIIMGEVVVSEGPTGLVAAFTDLGFSADLLSWDTDTAWFRYEPWDYEMVMTFWRDGAGNVDLLSTVAGVAARQGL